MPNGGGMRGGMQGGGMPSMNGFFGSWGGGGDRTNQEKIVLSTEDMEDLAVFVPDVADVTISYTTTTEVEGGELESAGSYTIAGVKNNYMTMSNLSMAAGEFLTSENDENKEKYCVLGYSIAKEIFGSIYAAYDDVVYIDARPYVVSGVLEEMGSVSSGISPDTAIFIPYETGVKYITGQNISPTITVIAADVNRVDTVIENVKTVLADSYANAEFTISDAGTKMEAASKSNDTLQLLLIAMAVIVFIVGGIGIMNVLFVSVKERTNEIGILKALGCSKRDILLEFLFEACFMSFIGSILGVLVAFGITPVVESFSVRVELSTLGALLSLAFGVITGTIFGFYPAYKASSLIPVVALNQE
ncbi:MAG: ABC transporter permease, partial [Lachnospiraceae bacterium]|nr:ABC transporter permease [Lachnospiraceae bacterium]